MGTQTLGFFPVILFFFPSLFQNTRFFSEQCHKNAMNTFFFHPWDSCRAGITWLLEVGEG